MSASEHSASQSSSKGSRAGRRKTNLTTAALFPIIKATLTNYHPKVISFGMLLEMLQPLSFALNPHVAGHISAWSILYFSQLPFWDATYSTGLTYSGFLAFYWVISAWAWLFLGFLVLGVEHTHFVATVVIKPFYKHILNLYSGVLLIPMIQMLLTTMSCTPDHPATSNATSLNSVASQVPHTVWLFKDQSCSDSVAVAHYSISIALMILWMGVMAVLASCNFATDSKAHTPKRRAHPYVDLAALLYKLGICICFHQLIPRGLTTYYSFILSVASFAIAALYAIILPYLDSTMNTVAVVQYSLVGWASLVVYIDAKLQSPIFTLQGGFYAVLILGGVVVAFAAKVLAGVRYSSKTNHLLKMALVPGFVPLDQNPFAVAAQSSNPEILPFPKNLPSSDFVFSPHRFVETDVIEEALRHEEARGSVDTNGAAIDEQTAVNRMAKYIKRVQVVSPTIDVAWFPTDAEVSTRFLAEWMALTDTAPTPHMLSFACRVFARFLLKFSESPTTAIAYVRFLTDYAPSLSRMNLSVKLLDSIPNEMFCDVYHLYQIYTLTMSVKEVLGVRDKNHEKMYRRSRRLHKETLIQTASLWRSLLDEDRNLVSLCFLSNNLSEVRQQCADTYLQAMNAASDDEVLFRSFANFVENVTQDKACASLCLEEAEQISKRRRAKLLQRVEEDISPAANAANSVAGVQVATSMSKSSVSRLHRGEDDAINALKSIVASVRTQTESLLVNLSSRSIFYTAIIMFVILCCVVAAHAAVVLTQFSMWTTETSRSFYAGDVRIKAQEIVAQVYKTSSALPTSTGATYSATSLTAEVNQLLALAYAFEASFNYITAGAAIQTDSAIIKFIKAPQLFLGQYFTKTSFTIESFTYWNAGDTLVQYCTRLAEFGATAPTKDEFLSSPDALFITENVPTKYSSILDQAIVEQGDAHTRLFAQNSVAFGVALGVFSLLVMSAAYIFVWNFRRSASAKVQALTLFHVIPHDTVKRLSNDAKERVERFVSGENMEKEVDHTQAMNELGGGDSTNLSSSGLGADGNMLLGQGDDDDNRRTSYTSKLLAHLFQHGGVETIDDDEDKAKADNTDAKPDQQTAQPGNENSKQSNNGIVPLLGSETENPLQQTPASATLPPPPGALGHKPSFSQSPYDDGLKDSKDPIQKEEKKKRHSISIGNVMKGMDHSKQRRSVLESMADPSIASEESPMERAEAETTAMVTDEDDPHDAHSFAKKSGITWLAVTLLFAITITSVVGIAMTVSAMNADAESERHVAKIQEEIICADHIRDTSLDMFFWAQRYSSSADYEDYQRFATLYKSYYLTKHNCLNNIPSLVTIDYDMYAQMLYQFEELVTVSTALVAKDLTPSLSALFSGVSWTAPTKTHRLVQLYKNYVPDIATRWFSYTTSAVDMALPVQSRRSLAFRVLYDKMGTAVFNQYLITQSNLASAISTRLKEEISKNLDSVTQYSAVAVAMWICTGLLSIGFVVQWTGSVMVRRTVVILTVVCAACIALAIATILASNAKAQNHMTYADQRLTRAILREHLSKQFFYGYSAVYIREDDAPIYDFLAVSIPLFLSSYQGAIILQLPFASEVAGVIPQTLEFISERGFPNRMIMVAVKLVTLATHTTLFNSEPRILGVQWNATAEPVNTYMLLKYPTDAALMYTNTAADSALSDINKLVLAENILSTKRLSEYTLTMLDTVDRVLATQKQDQVDRSLAGDGAFTTTVTAFVAVAALAMFVYVIFVVALGVASINSFSETQLEADMYDALYSKYSTNIGMGLSLVAACIVITGALAIGFTGSIVENQQVLFASSERAFLAANAMNYAEAMYTGTSLNEILLSRLQLRAVMDRDEATSQHAYFRSQIAFNLRAKQDSNLFGPQSAFNVRDTRTTLLQTSVASTCYNPANAIDGNQQSVAILYQQFMDTMKIMAQIDSNELVNITAGVLYMGTYMTQARLQYETLLDRLHVSDQNYLTAVQSDYTTKFAILIAILCAALGIVVIVLTFAVIPIIQRMTLHEAGTKLLLLLLPEDVKNQCPEIMDFYDADAGTKDDQLKKKLQQSEKLLQNILPPVISRRLKNGERVIADTHPNVTVVFAALIGFDEYSGTMEAKQIVHFLNSLIVTFDQITDLLELEKIKTIGDIYFLCGGLTKKTEGDHPLRCMECALLFLEAIGEHNQRHNTPNLTLRIGINTDPAVAGVIGSKKVAYDLWGDSVNTASRMQSTGLPGKIQVSDKTYQLIKEYFSFTDRKVAAKGKGELTTHIFAQKTKPTPYRHLNWRVAR